MKKIRYACSHCGRRFEDVEKEILECPGCYWSTSVKREEDSAASAGSAISSQAPAAQSLKAPLAQRVKDLWSKGEPVFMFVLVLILTAVLVFTLRPLIQTFLERSKIVFIPAKQEKKIKAQESAQTAGIPGGDILSAEDKAILDRRVEIKAGGLPNDQEQNILRFRASFQTGSVERLPTQSWNLENFKLLIAEKEQFYKVPLPGSYKKKLERGFQDKYLSAQSAFEAGDIQKARDLWAESLSFPIYANNIQKHRGVVLTMLRPFINDTLSKIGAINHILMESKTREIERQISGEYGAIFSAIEKQEWPQALEKIQVLEVKLSELENLVRASAPPPSYPEGVALVDDSVRATLIELLTPSPAGMADIEPLRRDLLTKKKVITGFLPSTLEGVQKHYQAAMQWIEQGEWMKAEQELLQVATPLEVAKDADEKIRVLKKLQKASA